MKRILEASNQTHLQSVLLDLEPGSMQHKRASPLTRSETNYVTNAMTQVRARIYETVEVMGGGEE
jgi:hypothetical protein